MSRRQRAVPILVWILAWAFLPGSAAAAAEPATRAATGDLRVMSFNIRMATPLDGSNAWPFRKDLLFRTIEAYDPDLLGLQEVLPTQGTELKDRLTAYEFIGVPRNDGKTSGEMVPVLFRRDRFEKVRDGTFWLSQTPEAVGSIGWDAKLPRIVTWVELRDRRNDDRPLLFLNAHFDHLGRQARLESAKLLRRKMIELAGEDVAVVVSGDFNAAQDSPPYKELLGIADAPLRLIETFKEATAKPTTQDFTFHGFTGENARATRIDWVLRSDHFRTSQAGIDRTNEEGRYPSDHFPVTAVLEWKETGAPKR